MSRFWSCLSIALLLGLLSAAAPSSALAATLFHAPANPDINYTADPGEINSVTVTFEAGSYRIVDAGVVAINNTGGGCAVIGNMATCPADPGGNSLFLDSGDQDDTVTVTAAIASTLQGKGGNDVLNGGPVNDDIRGGPGADTVDGGAGDDDLDGGDGLLTGDGPNILRGDQGNDTIYGADAVDMLFGGSGNDHILAGAGNDVAYGDEGDDALNGADGTDALHGGGGNDELGLDVSFGNNRVSPERGNDAMEGDAGDDQIRAGSGPVGSDSDSDTLSGGEGSDTVTYANRSSAVAVAIDGAANDGAVGEKDKVDPDVETLVGGSGDDKLKAGSLAVTLDGGDGDDSLSGSNGGDTLNGGDGDDTLKGGRGDDVEHGNAGDDTAFGGSGADTLDGAGGEDFLDGAAGPDDLKGGNGNDTLHSRDKAGKNKVDCGKGADFDIAAPRSKRKGCEDIDDDRGDRAVRGKRVALKPLGDELELEVPTMDRFVPLEDHVNAPVGSSIDATNGAIKLTSAGAVGGGASASRRPRSKKQTGVFSGGKFVVSQRRSRKAPTELRLKSNYKTCGGAKKGARSSRRHRTLLQRLLGRAHGHFRTRTRSTATTVRGTVWTTEDRCDGTLTSVKRGTVIVRDLHRHRDFVLKAGGRLFSGRYSGTVVRG
jgi:Ca2+-binding RTX toxin-like protein